MADFSLSTLVSLDLAVIETVASNYEYIHAEHMYCGITKLQDCLDEPLPYLSGEQMNLFRVEVVSLLSALSNLGVDPRFSRRMMRELLGDGGFEHQVGDVFHREPQLKAAFGRAEVLAAQYNENYVSIQRLLEAVLELDIPHLNELFGKFGTTRASVLESIRQLQIARILTPADIQVPPDTPSAVPPQKPDAEKGKTTPPSKASMLETFGIDLVELARGGSLHDVYEREPEIQEIILTLSRSKKNNPVLTGEPGVGKTAVVEGLAYRIANGRVPPHMLNRRIIQINLPQLVGGTEYRGQFEERMVKLVAEVQADPNVILFIDEIHMLVDAGGNNSSNAGNILKPALSRPGFTLIGATTMNEYRKHIESDEALERRFNPVRISEPTPAQTVQILLAGLKTLQKSYQDAIMIEEDAVHEAVKLADRYLPDRHFPDKAFELLDAACALARISFDYTMPQHIPAQIVTVTEDHVRQVANRYRVESEDDTLSRLRGLESYLKAQIIGQNEAISELVRSVQTNFMGIRRKDRPVGIFLFVGPTGVGKTELVRATAEALSGDPHNFIRLDMAEYKEKHSVARLIGSPPGYVGYQEGGQLTEKLRMNPTAIVLLDEIEKADVEVLDVLLQVFDYGRLTDGRGKTVDATRAMFIMTSNLGYGQTISEDDPLPSRDQVIQEVRWHLKPEFLNRIDRIVYFSPLAPEHMLEIVNVHFNRLKNRVFQEKQISLDLMDDARQWMSEKGYDIRHGARDLVRLIEQEIEQPLAVKLLWAQVVPGQALTVQLDSENDKLIITPGNNTTQD